MADETPVPVWFEGFEFPVWVVFDVKAAESIGESFATHFLTSLDGVKDMPLFTTEDKAGTYIAARGLIGHKPAPIRDVQDLLIRMELFRSRGGNYVRVDDTHGPSDGHPAFDIGDFIKFIRAA